MLVGGEPPAAASVWRLHRKLRSAQDASDVRRPLLRAAHHSVLLGSRLKAQLRPVVSAAEAVGAAVEPTEAVLVVLVVTRRRHPKRRPE